MQPFDWVKLRSHHRCSLLLSSVLAIFASVSFAQTIRVDSTPSHVAKTFVPTEALGAGIDRMNTAATDKLFTEPVIKQALSPVGKQ